MQKTNKYKRIFGKIVIVAILAVWFASLLQGLILESRHIRARYHQFGQKSPAQREEEVRRVEESLGGEGVGYMNIQNYLREIGNDRDN